MHRIILITILHGTRSQSNIEVVAHFISSKSCFHKKQQESGDKYQAKRQPVSHSSSYLFKERFRDIS